MKSNAKERGVPKCEDLHRQYVVGYWRSVVGFHSHFGKDDIKYFFVEEY